MRWTSEVQVPSMRSNDESFTIKSKPKLYRYYHNPNSTNTTLINCQEPVLDKVVFNRHINKNNIDGKPIILLSCLVEFGCETLMPHYFLNDFLQKYKNYHRIAVGWKGRNIFYHDFEEFWEMDDDYMFVRDYCLAFSSAGKNIKNIEKALKVYGTVFPSNIIGNVFYIKKCKNCGNPNLPIKDPLVCSKCNSQSMHPSILESPEEGKLLYKDVKFNLNKYKTFVKENIKSKKTIGIFARNRTTYGRNLPKDFYLEFIKILKNKNYEIIWLGEKQSVLPCPDPNIFDFTKSEYADDVGACLGLVSKCVATFQAWTASTRFSQLTDVPFCLVESYDQLYGRGQEGKRLVLLTKDTSKKKIIVSNFANSSLRLKEFINICTVNFLDFIENKNSNTITGIL